MIALVEKVFDRKTGECINSKIVKQLDIDEEKYFEPIAEIQANGFMKFWKDTLKPVTDNKLE